MLWEEGGEDRGKGVGGTCDMAFGGIDALSTSPGTSRLRSRSSDNIIRAQMSRVGVGL